MLGIQHKLALVALCVSTAVPAAEILSARHESLNVYTQEGVSCGKLSRAEVDGQHRRLLEEDRTRGILRIDPVGENKHCAWVLAFQVEYEPLSDTRPEKCLKMADAPRTDDIKRDPPAVSSGWGDQCDE